jgi:hypothetical protein
MWVRMTKYTSSTHYKILTLTFGLFISKFSST